MFEIVIVIKYLALNLDVFCRGMSVFIFFSRFICKNKRLLFMITSFFDYIIIHCCGFSRSRSSSRKTMSTRSKSPKGGKRKTKRRL